MGNGSSTKASENGRLVPATAILSTGANFNGLQPGISCDKTTRYCTSLPPGLLYSFPCNRTHSRFEKYQRISPYYQEVFEKLRPKKQFTDENSTIMFVHYYRNNLNYRIARVDRVNEWVTVKNCYLGLQFNNARTITVSAKS